jgi:predicted nucleic acid-binding protein
VSRLSLLECLVKPVRERNTPLIERYRSFFSATDLTIVEIAPLVIERALLIRADSNLRTPDAIQAASALSLTEPAIFVTGDIGFSKVSNLSSQIIS